MPNHSSLLKTARLLAGVALAIGGSVLLIRWATGPDFPAAHPIWLTLKANTAVGLILLACAGLGWERPAGRACAAGAALLGGLTLFQYATGRDLGLDLLLDLEFPVRGGGHPGRMAPSTALNLLALGLAALAPRPWHVLRRGLLALAASVTLLAFVGHAFQVPALYGMGTPTVMALNTATALVALQLLFLLRLEPAFWEETLRSQGIPRFLLRRFLPLALLLPILLDWIRLQAERTGILLREDSLALGTVTHTLVLLGLGLWTLRTIYGLEARRRTALEELERYRQVVDHQTTALTILHLDDPADDASLRVVAFNPTAQRTFDLDPVRDPGQRFVDLFPSLRDTTRLHLYAGVIRTGRPLDLGDVVYGDARRAPVTYAVKAFPLPGGYAAIAAEDASERVKVQRLKDEFVSLVSHELRTPLTAIQGSLDLLRGGVLGPLPPRCRTSWTWPPRTVGASRSSSRTCWTWNGSRRAGWSTTSRRWMPGIWWPRHLRPSSPSPAPWACASPWRPPRPGASPCAPMRTGSSRCSPTSSPTPPSTPPRAGRWWCTSWPNPRPCASK